jgi:hypothetical protein
LRKALSRKWKKSGKPDFGLIFRSYWFGLKNICKWATLSSI